MQCRFEDLIDEDTFESTTLAAGRRATSIGEVGLLLENYLEITRGAAHLVNRDYMQQE